MDPKIILILICILSIAISAIINYFVFTRWKGKEYIQSYSEDSETNRISRCIAKYGCPFYERFEIEDLKSEKIIDTMEMDFSGKEEEDDEH